MGADTAWRVLALCVALASAETLHGILRTVWLVPRLGKARALRWSIVSGSVLALAVCAAFVPGLGLVGVGPHLVLGAVVAGFMAAFDLVMGMTLLRRPWRKALQDFDPRTGNYLVFGLAVLALGPLAVAWLRGAV